MKINSLSAALLMFTIQAHAQLKNNSATQFVALTNWVAGPHKDAKLAWA